MSDLNILLCELAAELYTRGDVNLECEMYLIYLISLIIIFESVPD